MGEYCNFSHSTDDYHLPYYAVLRGSSEIVKTLLDTGSQINFANKNSDTPLHLAVLA
ncbi:MAG: ankyrin repeat domain-containing protein [Wolbachia sp.]